MWEVLIKSSRSRHEKIPNKSCLLLFFLNFFLKHELFRPEADLELGRIRFKEHSRRAAAARDDWGQWEPNMEEKTGCMPPAATLPLPHTHTPLLKTLASSRDQKGDITTRRVTGSDTTLLVELQRGHCLCLWPPTPHPRTVSFHWDVSISLCPDRCSSLKIKKKKKFFLKRPELRHKPG